MREYKHILFDLDDTLWDFKGNSKEAFGDIYDDYNLSEFEPDPVIFDKVYHKFNTRLWEDYRDGKIEKEELRWKRFYLTLEEFGVRDRELAGKIDQEYITRSPQKTRLMPFAREILEFLQPEYALHIVTNGFNEVQFTKLSNARLEDYFTHVITSEMAGFLKPHPEFFSFTLKTIKAKAEECLIIGDNYEVDIEGAMRMGIDQVYYNPDGIVAERAPTYIIKSLMELKDIL